MRLEMERFKLKIMSTDNNKLKMFTFDEIKDEFIGETGSAKRNKN